MADFICNKAPTTATVQRPKIKYTIGKLLLLWHNPLDTNVNFLQCRNDTILRRSKISYLKHVLCLVA